MNDCSGNGAWLANEDRCICNDGWKFADCSLETETLDEGFSKTFSTYGPKWFSLSYEGGSDNIRLTLRSDTPMDVYISKSYTSDPTSFSFDMDFLEVKSLDLSSLNFPVLDDQSGFSVAIYKEDYDEPANTILSSNLDVEFSIEGFEWCIDERSPSSNSEIKSCTLYALRNYYSSRQFF